jgi:HSP20 family protein
MARQRNLVVNIERMRRDMDELLGEGWATVEPRSGGRSDFHPRVDVYYSEGPTGPGEGDAIAKAVVTVDLAGVGADAVNVEISGRMLVISGTRPVRRTEGRAYQQVEIPTGTFRRAIELGVDVDSNRARAAFENGLLKVELPIELPEATARRVPIDRPSD